MERNSDLADNSDHSPVAVKYSKKTYKFPPTHIFRDEPVSQGKGGSNLSKSRIWLKESDFDKMFEFLASKSDGTRVTEKDIKTKLPFFK